MCSMELADHAVAAWSCATWLRAETGTDTGQQLVAAAHLRIPLAVQTLSQLHTLPSELSVAAARHRH
jgi:hypothetical protein